MPILAASMPIAVKVILIILGVIIVLFAILIILGRKMQKKQAASQSSIEAASQVLSLLIIDKKRMKMKDSNLPKTVMDQVPKYMRGAKMPLVKAKVGPKIFTLISDVKIFDSLPIKTEVKAKVSGIYITEIISIRGKAVPVATPKGFRAKLVAKANKSQARAQQKAKEIESGQKTSLGKKK